LSQARSKAAKAGAKLAQGSSPVDERREQKEAGLSGTLSQQNVKNNLNF